MVQATQSLIGEVERGPGWLLVRLDAVQLETDKSALAEQLCSLMDQHFTYRIVLECDDIGLLDSTLIGQLLLLERRVRKQGGLLRLCGLSACNEEALHRCRLDGRLPHFASRSAAILGHRPLQSCTMEAPVTRAHVQSSRVSKPR